MTLQLTGFRVRNRPPVSGRRLDPDMSEQMANNIRDAETQIAEPFRGLTADGQVVPGLFSLQKTGLSNEGMKRAAEAWLASIDSGQRDSALFSVDSDAWRRWSNIHVFLMRHGVMMEDMTQGQRESGFRSATGEFQSKRLRTGPQHHEAQRVHAGDHRQG